LDTKWRQIVYDFEEALVNATSLRPGLWLVTLKLNQQQLELIDRTIAFGIAPDRESLIKLALREYSSAHACDDKEKQ
jgi:hypothetical protein